MYVTKLPIWYFELHKHSFSHFAELKKKKLFEGLVVTEHLQYIYDVYG